MATFPLVKIMEIVLIAVNSDPYHLGNISSDPELDCTPGRLRKRQQIRNLIFLKVHDLDRGHCFYLPYTPFL